MPKLQHVAPCHTKTQSNHARYHSETHYSHVVESTAAAVVAMRSKYLHAAGRSAAEAVARMAEMVAPASSTAGDKCEGVIRDEVRKKEPRFIRSFCDNSERMT